MGRPGCYGTAAPAACPLGGPVLADVQFPMLWTVLSFSVVADLQMPTNYFI